MCWTISIVCLHLMSCSTNKLILEPPDNYELNEWNIGDEYYTDRDYIITAYPPVLDSTLLLKTPNDKKNDTLGVTIEINQPFDCYIAYDFLRAGVLPDWLLTYEPTGLELNTTDVTLHLFKHEHEGGEIDLGGNRQPTSHAGSMYVGFFDLREIQWVDVLPGDTLMILCDMPLETDIARYSFHVDSEIIFEFTEWEDDLEYEGILKRGMLGVIDGLEGEYIARLSAVDNASNRSRLSHNVYLRILGDTVQPSRPAGIIIVEF